MKFFHDLDPGNPYEVTGEKQTIENGKITLDHIPLKGSVTVIGFTEDITGTLANPQSWHTDYRENTGYRAADGVLRFSDSEGEEVTVNYYGVGTMFRAKDVNELASMVANHDADENAHGFQTAISIATAAIVAQMRLDSADRINGMETISSAIRSQTATLNSRLTVIENTLKDGLSELKAAVENLGDKIESNNTKEQLAKIKEAIHSLDNSVKNLEMNITVQCSCKGGDNSDKGNYDWDGGDLDDGEITYYDYIHDALDLDNIDGGPMYNIFADGGDLDEETIWDGGNIAVGDVTPTESKDALDLDDNEPVYTSTNDPGDLDTGNLVA